MVQALWTASCQALKSLYRLILRCPQPVANPGLGRQISRLVDKFAKQEPVAQRFPSVLDE
jgi:hypothetical protein